MGSLDKRPSKIPQSQGYKGVGRNPDSKIKQSNGYSGVGKSPEAKLNDQIKRIDKALADEAKKRGDEPPPSISPRGSEMTMEQKMEALRTARSSWNERNIEELSGRPSPSPDQPSSEPSPKQQFSTTTDIVEEKPERPELVDDTTTVSKTNADTGKHPFKITTSTTDNGQVKYQLSKGSIQDGTNGDAIDLTGIIETDLDASAGYVVIEATVAQDLTLSEWRAVIHSDVAYADEVKMSDADPTRQQTVRLLIGKITIAEDIATAWQAWYTSARVSHGFLNGSLVRVFESAPTEASKI